MKFAPLTHILGLEPPKMVFWEDLRISGRTPHADPRPRTSKNGVLGTSAHRWMHPSRRSLASKCQKWCSGSFCKFSAHPSRRSLASELQEWRFGSIRKSQGAPLAHILGLGSPGMAFWGDLQIQGHILTQILRLGAPGTVFWKGLPICASCAPCAPRAPCALHPPLSR